MAAGNVETNITSPNAKAGAIFDGTNDEIDLGDLFETGFNKLSFSLWFKANNTTRRYILSKENVNNDDRFYLMLNLTAGKITFRYEGSATGLKEIDYNYNNNEWINIIIVINGTTNKIYINGILRDSIASTAPLLSGHSTNMTIGNRPGVGEFFSGIITNFQVYQNKELSITEIENISNNLSATGLTNYYKLESDYTDSVGSNDGINVGSMLGISDEDISAAIAADRTTANDIYLIADSGRGKQAISVIIEEAP